MNKFCKVLAVILAVLMLVTMATACKSGDENEWDVNVSDDAFGDDSTGDNSNDSDKDSDSDKNQGSTGDDKNNQSGSGDKNNNTNNNNSNTDKSPTEDDKTVGAGDDKDTQKDIVEQYDGTKKYDMANNPLLAESKEINHGILPSFDMDTTGFVKNDVKLKDLKGKTFTFFTAEGKDNFYYTDKNGKLIGEWEWWESLKGELGVTVKYFESHHNKSHSQIMTYMNAGKSLDLIPTHIGGMPLYFKLCQPLNPYVNLQNIGNSPGVDEMTLEETKIGGNYQCIAPIGAADMLVYNQSLVEELNLKDPHKMWQNDEWDWNAYRSFLTSVPATTADGKPLFATSGPVNSWWYAYPLTNGVTIVDLDSNSKELKLVNNWLDERVIESLTFYADVMKSVKDTTTPSDGNTLKTEANYGRLFDGTLMRSNRVWMMTDQADNDYARNRKYNWVPFPKGTGEHGRYAVHTYGLTMTIPKIVKNKSNIPYAVKFAELWANRCTEALFDYFEEQPHINFSYAQKKEYFEFCVKNTYFALQMNEWRNLSGENFKAMRDAATGYIWAAYLPEINMATKHREVANVVDAAIQTCLNFE